MSFPSTKNPHSSVDNYRPITLTSYICKTLETLIKRKLVDYLNEKNLLSDCQHGFVKHRSTITNLIYFFNKLFSFSNNRFPMDVIFLDLSKAFDSVIHSKLICKIRSYGIKGRILNWIIDFLKNRTFCVNVNDSLSPMAKVETGTPQGSVLSPLLFLLYINDMPDTLNIFSVLFADDVKIFDTIVHNDSYRISSSLLAFVLWTDLWQLSVSIEKCSCLHIGAKNPKTTYFLKNLSIECIDTIKDLGISYNNRLSFSHTFMKLLKKPLEYQILFFMFLKVKITNFL